MVKFNVVQKQKRARIAERKRTTHGDPLTGKLKNKPQPIAVSGKRQRKLLKKWRRDQKEAVKKGLVNIHDLEMASAEVLSKDTNKVPRSFQMKKKLKVKLSKQKGENKPSSKPSVEASADAMLE